MTLCSLTHGQQPFRSTSTLQLQVNSSTMKMKAAGSSIINFHLQNSMVPQVRLQSWHCFKQRYTYLQSLDAYATKFCRVAPNFFSIHYCMSPPTVQKFVTSHALSRNTMSFHKLPLHSLTGGLKHTYTNFCTPIYLQENMWHFSARKCNGSHKETITIIHRGLRPPCLPNLHMCDFYLCGMLKDKVHKNKPHNEDNLKRKHSECSVFNFNSRTATWNKFIKCDTVLWA